MRKPKLLFLCQTLPYPPAEGVAIRTYHVLRLLSRHFEVRLLCFYRRPAREGLEGNVATLRELVPTEVFPIPGETSRWRNAWDHLRSLLTGRVYTEFVYDSGAFRAALREALAEEWALIHVDSLDLAAYLPELPDVPVVCVHHNVESRLLARRAGVERSRAVRAYVRHQARLMERCERAWCARFPLNVVVSEEDGRILESIVPGARTLVVPNGVDVDRFHPAPGRDEGLVFVGGETWFPNQDAMQHFVRDVAPLLERELGPVTTTWVGRVSDATRRALSSASFRVTGFVDDIRPYVHDAACFIVPLRVGGGTRLKILDAWAMGKAVVSTSVGCEGLDARHGENILVADSAAEFAAAVARVLRDPALRRHLGNGARRTAVERYGWEVIGEGLVPAYRALLGHAAADEAREASPSASRPAVAAR